MANGYFERGEIYWVRVDAGVGSETGIGRPGLIVSCQKSNDASECVNIAWLTTQNKPLPWHILTFSTGKRSFIMCNQIATIDKSRIGKFLSKLPPDEMKEVDTALEEQFDLGYIDDSAVKEKEIEIAALETEKKELLTEVALLKAKLEVAEAKHKDELLAQRVEVDMWQGLYMKSLDQVVSMKLNGDIAIRTEKRPVVPEEPVVLEVPKNPEPPKVEETQEPELLDINTCKFSELRDAGLSSNIVLTIINRRPHKKLEDIKNVPGMTKSMYQIMSKKLCCIYEPPKKAIVVPDPGYEEEEPVVAPEEPKPTGKVNVNTATGAEIHRVGIAQAPAYAIVKYRREHGTFKTLDDLLNVPYCGKIFMSRHRDKLEV